MSDKILTQQELTIDLSVPAMKIIANALKGWDWNPEPVQCEIDNFRNTLLNLIERGVDRHAPTDEELCS